MRKVEGDGEENKTLDRAMKYTGVVGVELVDIVITAVFRVILNFYFTLTDS